jgi:hypothetical protein
LPRSAGVEDRGLKTSARKQPLERRLGAAFGFACLMAVSVATKLPDRVFELPEHLAVLDPGFPRASADDGGKNNA